MWCVRDMRSNVRTVCMLYIVYAITEVAKNRAPPRSQSAPKQKALFYTIETLLRQGIITKSSSPYYSQVFLVPKPDNTFLMCVD